MTQLKLDLETQRELILELENKVAQAPSDDEISALNNAVSDSEAVAGELQNAKQELASLSDQLKISQLEVRDLKESQETISNQLTIAESLLVEKDSELESLSTDLSEQAALASLAATQKTEILNLQESLSTTDSNQDAIQRDLTQSRLQLASTQKALENANVAANELSDLLDKSQRETRQWEEENKSLKQLVSQQQTDADQLRSEQETALERAADLENQVKQFKARSEEFDKQRSKLESLMVELEGVSKEKTELSQEIHTANGRLEKFDAALEENSTLSRKVLELEQKMEISQQDKSGLLEEKSAQVKHLSHKVDALGEQTGKLQASLDHSESANEELKGVIEAQKSRIRELEKSFASSSELAGRNSETAEQSRITLSNIEATLKQQADRMHSLEKINQQSLAKIDELQSAPSPRKSSRKKLPEGHEDLSEISGVGPKFRQKLFELGVKTVQEIAAWSDEDTKTFAEKVGCGDRTTKQWSEKASELVRSRVKDSAE